MKRHEALDIIKDTLDELKGYKVDDEYVAQAIMSALESAGMQPPPVRVIIDDSFDSITLNIWEEDEKNRDDR